MSYSYTVVGTTGQEVKDKANLEFDNVEQQQPPHKFDRQVAMTNLNGMLTLVGEPKTDEQLRVTMVGTLSGDLDYATNTVRRLTALTTNCTVRVEKRV